MLSGLTFRVKKEERVIEFIKRKARTIFPPLFFFCGIEVVFQMFFEKLLNKLSVEFVIESLLFMNGGAFSKYWFCQLYSLQRLFFLQSSSYLATQNGELL